MVNFRDLPSTNRFISITLLRKNVVCFNHTLVLANKYGYDMKYEHGNDTRLGIKVWFWLKSIRIN